MQLKSNSLRFSNEQTINGPILDGIFRVLRIRVIVVAAS